MRAVVLSFLASLGFYSGELSSDDGDVAFYLPFECGHTVGVSQGNHGSFSHGGRARYAFDFDVPRGTPLVAMADGSVLFAKDSTREGDRCWDGGDSSCFLQSNLVVLEHADGSTTIYKHLDDVSVSVGDRVKRGELLGHSGNTGYSTGPHAHIMRQRACGEPDCESLPLHFVDVAEDGIPDTDDVVTACRDE